MMFSSIVPFPFNTFPQCTRYGTPRGIADLLSTSSNIDVAFCFFSAFNADCLSAARSHVSCYFVLLNLILRLNNGLSCNLIEMREDVGVELL